MSAHVREVLPDRPLVRDALEVASASVAPVIMAHSARVYLLGRAFAARRRLAYDDEGLALAAIFHDVGLNPAFRAPRQAFNIASGDHLARFLRERGEPEDRIGPLVLAVEVHMQPVPRWSKGSVAGLLHIGAWMDAAGLRRASVREEAAHIEERLPRDAFAATFRASFLSSLNSVSGCLGLIAPGYFSRSRAAVTTLASAAK